MHMSRDPLFYALTSRCCWASSCIPLTCHTPLSHTWHDSFICRMTHCFMHIFITWLHVCFCAPYILFVRDIDMTHSYVTFIWHIRTWCPPAPMNHVKYLRAGPAEMPFQNWYTANTNHFRLTDSVRWKSKTQQGWVTNPVPHNLVRRIRFWRIQISGTWFDVFVLDNK